jgi:hypothetical protein
VLLTWALKEIVFCMLRLGWHSQTVVTFLQVSHINNFVSMHCHLYGLSVCVSKIF